MPVPSESHTDTRSQHYSGFATGFIKAQNVAVGSSSVLPSKSIGVEAYANPELTLQPPLLGTLAIPNSSSTPFSTAQGPEGSSEIDGLYGEK